MNPMRFRKRPVYIDAMELLPGGGEYVVDWIFRRGRSATLKQAHQDDDGSILIETLEGTMRADVGDFIVCGVEGEFYPVKPAIFAKTYERAEA